MFATGMNKQGGRFYSPTKLDFLAKTSLKLRLSKCEKLKFAIKINFVPKKSK